MEALSKPVLLLALALFLAIGTERLLELVRALMEHLEARRGTADRWQKRAEALRDRIELRLNNAAGSGAAVLRAVVAVACRHLSPPTPESGGQIAIDADELRKMSLRLRCKVIGIVIGIGLAFLFGLDIFALVNEGSRQAADPGTGAAAGEGLRAAVQERVVAVVTLPFKLPGWIGMIIAGVAMGLGAGPVHKIITALERARQMRK